LKRFEKLETLISAVPFVPYFQLTGGTYILNPRFSFISAEYLTFFELNTIFAINPNKIIIATSINRMSKPPLFNAEPL